MKQVQDAYIVAATRTPIGKAPRGMFKNTRPDDLLVAAIRGAMAQVPTLDPHSVEDAIVGCAIPEGQQGLNVARIAVLLAGLPNSVGGVTVNRFCASGLTTIAMAADRIRVGEADVMIAAGCESMSMVPMMGNAPSMNSGIFTDENIGIAYGMGLTAEKVAEQWKVSREAQDTFSVESHRRAMAAIAAGHFKAEITPVQINERFPNLATGEVIAKSRLADTDEGPRADTSMEGLGKLRAVFASAKDSGGAPTGLGTVTAGNSSQTSDGAGALIVVSEKALKQYNLTPLARFVSFSIKGVPPHIMGIGPKEAIPLALQRAGIKQDDLGWIELNEAFAAQSLAVIQDLGLNTDVVNPNGGAIALGHPLGATGAMRAATCVHGLRRTGKKYGMVTMCVGTGMGAAGVFERM
jgi:acetyl-CoA acyltransferase